MFAVSSWSKVWDVEDVTSFAVLPNGVCSQSECGLLPSLWRCFSFCPISDHESIGGRNSSRLRATKKYWTLPKSCGSQSSGWEERKKSRAKRGSLCARRRWTVTCHGLRVVEPVYHQASLRGRWRSWRRSARRTGLGEAALFVISQDSHIDFFF